MSDEFVLLQAALAAEREARVVERSHAAADYEILRTRVLRALRQQKSLLIDARHALGDQRYEIVDEFVERVRDALSKEIDYLQNLREGQ